MPQPYNNAIRLAVITETWPPEVNGVANTAHKLVTGLLNKDHYHIQLVRPQQQTADTSQHPALEEVLVSGLTLPFYKEVRLGFPHYFRLKKHWRQQRPDIVQIVTEGPLGYSAVKAAHALGIPVFSDFHTNFDQYSRYYRLSALFKLAKHYLRHLHNLTAVTLVPTQSMLRELKREGYKKLGILDRGVDTTLFTPAKRSTELREALGIRPEQLLVVLVTRLAKEKNLDLAFETFAAIKQVLPDAGFVIVGDGPERARLEAAHPDCLFAGMQRGEKLAGYFASGDLFLYPSTSETFGNVITEAMASGLPVVAFDYAAAEEHIRSEQNGIAIPLTDNQQFIQAGVRLAQDEQHRKHLGEQARLTAADLSWNRVIDRLDRTIQQLLDEAKS